MVRLKWFREREGLTQQQLADKLSSDKYRVTQNGISGIETNCNNPSYAFMRAFKKAFPQYKIDDVFFYNV